MDICRIPGRFSATPLKLNHFPRNLNLPRSQTPPFCPRIPVAVNLLSDTDLSEPKSRNRMFILGMGFVGRFFAQVLKNQGWVVSGTCTSIMKKKKLEEKGFDIYLFDANEPEQSTLDIMKNHTHLVVSIPPVVGVGDPMVQHEELLRSTLMDGNLQWLGVYGDCGGAWVDEDYPTRPTRESANLRLVAEQRWLEMGDDLGLSAQVFRLGGIYGPGRSAVDTIIKKGALSEGQKMRVYKQYTSRIHVEDICQALKASIHAPSHGKVYNIVDDDPAPREEVFAYARDLVEKKWPGQIKQSTNESESFIKKGSPRGEKRVSNARMKKELGVRLLHPSYESVGIDLQLEKSTSQKIQYVPGNTFVTLTFLDLLLSPSLVLQLPCQKVFGIEKALNINVRMAEWSKAPDSSSGLRERAWVQIPLLTYGEIIKDSD
uniref:NAD-dependent epimerase/dehydratase domain-containing protein n=2 Tax=rosids TaxID=71275 RepID=A0A2N9IK42_FAGSY